MKKPGKKASIFTSVVILVLTFSNISYSQQADSLRVRKVNPTGALIRSAFVPGWGQFYNRKYIKATIFAGGESYLIYGIAKYWRDANHHRSNFEHSSDPVFQTSEFNKYTTSRDSRNLRLWLLAASIFYSMFDAYVDAQLSDFNQTDKAYQVYLAPASSDGLQLVLNVKIK
jgi:hypothetical protein